MVYHQRAINQNRSYSSISARPMSLFEASGQDLNPTRDCPDHLAGTLDSDIPPDPLLQSGSFIDATAAAATSNGKTKHSEPVVIGSGQESTEDGGPGRKRKPVEPLENWLPQGWLVEERVRTSGATAGSTDRYYKDPVSGRRFRSKTEVLYFLETGTLKKKKTTDNANAEKPSVEGSGSQKQKKSSTKPKSVLKFDHANVPETVSWAFTDSSKGSWTPFSGNERVPESTTQEWAAAFTFATTSK